MQTQNSSGSKAFIANSSIGEGLRVKLISAGVVDVAGVTDMAIGVAACGAAAGVPVTVRLFNAAGTVLMQAAGAITIGTQLFPAANGQISGTGTTALNFVNIEPATAAGDFIECTRCFKGA